MPGSPLSPLDPQLAHTISGREPSPAAAAAGERAFFDGRLSHVGWMSCHSCHPDGHSAGLLADTNGDGTFGTPKRIPSLLGGGQTGPWGWLGNKSSLSEQIQQTLETTMQHKDSDAKTVPSLVAYVQSLGPPPAGPLVPEGARLFARLKCVRCHTPETWTSADRYDVGLQDEAGQQLFNPPSLRGLRFRDALFHDASAGTARDVLLRNHQLSPDVTAEERQLLLRYLMSL